MAGAAGEQPPETACCLKCHYLLRGLVEPVCPECGRPFDPADPTTFLAAPPRRKWVKRLAIVSVLLLVGFALFPRKVDRLDLTVTCHGCWEQLVATRRELRAPDWVPLRYPGYTSMVRQRARFCPDQHGRTGTVPIPPTTQPASVCRHCYSMSFRHKGANSGSNGAGRGRVPTLNGMEVTFSTAESVLKTMASPKVRMMAIASVADDE